MVEHSGYSDNPIFAEESQNMMPNQSETSLGDNLNPKHSSNPIPSGFWSGYERVAKQHDDEFLERHHSDLDVLLIFAGLFCGVTSAFIVSMSSSLTPSPSETTNVLLKLLINKIEPGTFSDQDVALPVWIGPSYTVVWTQSLAYASLCVGLLVGVGAVLGKQWLISFKTLRFGSGTLEQRCKNRQQKLDGLETWQFNTLMSLLPTFLQLSLLFFGISLSQNLWIEQQTISCVIIGTTVCGQIFYMLTIVAAVKYPDCPFQTLVSMCMKGAWEGLFNWHPSSLWGHVKETGIRCSEIWQKSYTNDPESPPSPQQPSAKVLDLKLSPPQPVEAHAVRWILDTCTDEDILTAAARMVPEVEWLNGDDVAIVAERLRNLFMACFNPTHQLLPLAKDRALACLKALSHCYLEEHIHIRNDDDERHAIISQYRKIFSLDTAFQFQLISGIITKQATSKLDITSLSSFDRMWLAHLIPHCLYQGRCDDDWKDIVINFTRTCLQDLNSPPRLVVDCLLSAGLMMRLHVDQWHVEQRLLAKLDKSAVTIEVLLASLAKNMLRLLPSELQGSHADMTPVAVKLLHPLSQQIQKYRKCLDVEDNTISVKYLTLCHDLLRIKQGTYTTQALSGDVHLSQCVGAILRISFSFSVGKGNEVIWRYFDQLVDFLIQLFQRNDCITIGDVFVILESLQSLPRTQEEKKIYLQGIIDSMGKNIAPYLCLAALNGAWMIQTDIVSIAQDDEFLREKFSQALSLAVRAGERTTQQESDGVFHLDSFFYEKRDQWYHNLLCTLLLEPAWHNHLSQYGHYDGLS